MPAVSNKITDPRSKQGISRPFHGIFAFVLSGLEKGKIEGKAKGLAKGEAKGKAEGKNKRSAEVALNMKKKGLDFAMISEMTGLSAAEIKKL